MNEPKLPYHPGEMRAGKLLADIQEKHTAFKTKTDALLASIDKALTEARRQADTMDRELESLEKETVRDIRAALIDLFMEK